MTVSVDYLVDLTEANVAAVLGRSQQVPVLADFWADWCAPCKQMAPILEKLAHEYKGRFILARVNADREPMITRQFGVQGLPTLKLVFQGQLVGELTGTQSEAAIRRLLAPCLAAAVPAEEPAGHDFYAQVLAALQAGHVEEAMAALSAKLRDEKDDHKSRTLLAEVLLQENRLDEAQSVLDAASADIVELQRPRALLAFARRVASVPILAELEALMRGEPTTEIRYHYALRLVSGNRLEEGLDLLLDIVRRDRQYGEDAARKTLLEVFGMLGRDDPLTATYRRRMAGLLH